MNNAPAYNDGHPAPETGWKENDAGSFGYTTVASRAPRIIVINVTDGAITANLPDGRTVNAPPAWLGRFSDTTPEPRSQFEIIVVGGGVHRPDIDEDISAHGLLRGMPAQPPKQVTPLL